MPKFKELREAKGLLAKQVAERASVDVTMYSRFEKYRALPIPCDFERILDALECLPSDVYTPDEVRLLPNATKVEATGGARVDREPTEYKMTVRLDNNSRQVNTYASNVFDRLKHTNNTNRSRMIRRKCSGKNGKWT